jgi:hypothetical protein
MSTKNRIQKAELAHKKASRGERGRLFVYYAGQDFGTINGAQVSLADFEATRAGNDVALKVVYRNRSTGARS